MIRQGAELYVAALALAFTALFLCTLDAITIGWLYWAIAATGGVSILICIYLRFVEDWRWALAPPVLISAVALTDWALRFHYGMRLL